MLLHVSIRRSLAMSAAAVVLLTGIGASVIQTRAPAERSSVSRTEVSEYDASKNDPAIETLTAVRT